MKSRFPLRTAVAAALLLAALPAAAGLFDDDEARKGVAQANQKIGEIQRSLDQRVATIENIVKSQGLVDLLSQVEALRTDLAKLRGQVEVMVNDIDQTQKRQRDLYLDLDSRVRKLEESKTAAPEPSPAATPPATPGSVFSPAAASPGVAAIAPPAAATPPVDQTAEQRLYDQALEHFRTGNFSPAISGFQSFVKLYPRSPLAPSAQYWVGNSFFAQKDYRNALAEQRKLLAAYPDSQKIPDALLNIASAQTELGDVKEARRTLEEIVAKYPLTDAATKARQRLTGGRTR